MNLFVCSDIHGHFDLWMELIEMSRIDFENGDELIILGDLIDRGKQSKECVEFALELVDKYPNQVTYLMGNHEKMLLEFVSVRDTKSVEGYVDLEMTGRSWVLNGGMQTMLSLLVGVPEEETIKFIDVHRHLNDKYAHLINRLNNLPYYKVDTDRGFVFVHAGFQTGIKLVDQNNEDMVWIRDDFFNHYQPVKDDVLDGLTVVHGHTPAQYFNTYKGSGYFHGGHHVCIDGGIAMKEKLIMLKIDKGGRISYIEAPYHQ